MLLPAATFESRHAAGRSPRATRRALNAGRRRERRGALALRLMVSAAFGSGNATHTFVAIVAPGGSAAPQVAAAVRPQVSAALRSALERHQLARLGERVAATRQ